LLFLSFQLEGSKLKHQLKGEERELLKQLKGKVTVTTPQFIKPEVTPLFRPKRKAKGPNPLSVKKKERKETGTGSKEKKKRKRKKEHALPPSS